MIRRTLPLLALLALAGCSASSLLAPSGPAPALYDLPPTSVPRAAEPAAKWQLLVETPDAALDLNSARIAIRPEPTRIDYYADVSWADRAPVLIQKRIIDAFDESQRIASVGRQGVGLRSDFMLNSELRDFEVDATGGAPVARLKLTAKLVRTRDRTIVATRVFEATAPVAGDFSATIQAFGSTLNEVLPQLVDWTVTAGTKSP